MCYLKDDQVLMIRLIQSLMAILIVALVLFPPAAIAHPHVWVTSKTEIIHDAQGRVSGFHHHWTFDEVFSTFAVQGMDKNGDGKFDRKELEALAKVNITSLSEFDFFTFATNADKPVKLGAPSDGYFLSHEEGKLTLHFVLPLKTPLDARKTQIKFSIYDPTYYVAFSYAETSPVKLASNAPKGCHIEMHKPAPPSSKEQNLSDLSEAFYKELGEGSDLGGQFSRDVLIACKAG